MGTIPPAPSAAVTGLNAGATQFNALAAQAAFWANPPRCYAYDNTGFSVPNNAFTSVALNAELFDDPNNYDGGSDAAMHDNVTANTKIFARTTGKYTINGVVTIAANATGVRSAQLIVNGGGTQYAFNTSVGTASVSAVLELGPVEISLTAGDYIEIQAFQNSGGALACVAGQGKTFLRFKLSGS